MKASLLPGHPSVWSPDNLYRYVLWRTFCEQPRNYVMFVGLNPSTADDTKDDPTLRRCIGFARAWGFDALCMTNLFAYRATDPRQMKGYSRPIGHENDRWLTACAREANLVVAAWGTTGQFMARDEEVRSLLDDLHVLDLTKGGHPRHPLYARGSSRPLPWGTL
jgi:hypothetical protein